jgi:hypothetical protein
MAVFNDGFILDIKYGPIEVNIFLFYRIKYNFHRGKYIIEEKYSRCTEGNISSME